MRRQYGRVVELVDSLDSGSSVHCGRAGSSPASPTKKRTSERMSFSLRGFNMPIHNKVPARFVCISAVGRNSCSARSSPRRQRSSALHLGYSNLGAVAPKKRHTPKGVCLFLEVPARFELANNGFADRGLTTWLRYHMEIRNAWIRS